MEPNLSIILVNYKTPELTKRCIESIYISHISIEFEIIVVDNCSKDDSEKMICSKFPAVKWINNIENTGFGRGNNLGVFYSKGQHLLLLNSDIILETNTVEECLEYFRRNENIGVLGCKLLNEDRTIQKSTYQYIGTYIGVLKENILLDYFVRFKETKVHAVMGAFMLIPKKVFEEVNGFDPDFFMYAEELDLCRRIEKRGYKIIYLDSVSAIHKHGGSSKGSDWATKQNYLSTALSYLKVKGVGGYFVYHFLMCINFISNLALLWKMDNQYRRDFWENQRNYYSNFIYYLKIPFLYSKEQGNGKRVLKRA